MSKVFISFRNHQCKKKRTNRRFFRPGSKILISLLISSLFLVGSVYLWQINKSAAKGFEIKKLEEKVNYLKEENKRLELETIELQSLSRIREGAKKINLTANISPEYLQPASPVAIKK